MDNTKFFQNTNLVLNFSYPRDPNTGDLSNQTIDIPVSTTVKPSPEQMPDPYYGESSTDEINTRASSSGSERTVTYDNQGNKIAALYMKNQKKAWSVYSDSYGNLSVSLIDTSVTNASWTTPMPINVQMTSGIHMVYTSYGFPAIVGCYGSMFTIAYLNSSNSRVVVSSSLPGNANAVQGLYAINSESNCEFCQATVITDSGQMYNSFIELYETQVGQTIWDNWGSHWSGSPCIGYSNATSWLFAKYTGGSRAYLSYTWANLNDHSNYGMWHNMNYLSSGVNFVGSPTIARNHNSNGTILLAVFSRTDKPGVAFSVCDSANGYPSSSFRQIALPFTPEIDFQFPDVGINSAPCITVAGGFILRASFYNKESNLSQFEQLGEDSIYSCTVVINAKVPGSSQVNDTDSNRMKLYTFSKTTSYEYQSFDSGEFLLPFVYF
ncbi:hypothetical protein DLAC_05705 [Tieghemostelium lacteum]|uniref:Uncharacterized protein n=1 Tax=Tieghemostelium lacteum TaxID=361077 RepID=A0A151ZGU5_TIELA|nr:hypothetical protein DLAC_05705 [Tieghemostelium lacteum]|eukprot:KYQ93084.1 hypothetical protein DLAC_05705 [Tieghemostelium lacteum]